MTLDSQTSPVIALEFSIERRCGLRVPVDIRARVKSLDPVTSLGPSTAARIVDISQRGLKLRVGRPLMLGASVQILAERKIFLGKVRYCRSVHDDFYIGVRLMDSDS
jgi:hypothetical protein